MELCVGPELSPIARPPPCESDREILLHLCSQVSLPRLPGKRFRSWPDVLVPFWSHSYRCCNILGFGSLLLSSTWSNPFGSGLKTFSWMDISWKVLSINGSKPDVRVCRGPIRSLAAVLTSNSQVLWKAQSVKQTGVDIPAVLHTCKKKTLAKINIKTTTNTSKDNNKEQWMAAVMFSSLRLDF